jgi:hypothetical protein
MCYDVPRCEARCCVKSCFKCVHACFMFLYVCV